MTITARMRSTHVLHRAMQAVAGLLVPAIVAASMTIITLPDLVNKSATIAYGHVDGKSLSVSSGHPMPVVTFDVVQGLKGNAVSGQQINLCNSHLSSERPDLSKMTGALVVFASPQGSCLELSHGSRSVIAFAGRRAQTYMLEGEPHDQSLEEFAQKIGSIASHQAHNH